ncbi:MAG: methanogen output domain 1-containing protein [Geminicoccaceae bacterium]
MTHDTDNPFANAPISRDRDHFLRELLRELMSILEDTVGLEEAEGFIALVGGRVGQVMDEEYRSANGRRKLDRQTVAHALVDLKRRINGGFAIERVDDEKIVLVNTACPFAEHVEGRKSLCMMTSNVFGRISANNLGYARVDLEETIAAGQSRCRVVIHLVEGEDGREYFS